MSLEIPIKEPTKPDIFSYGFNDFLHRKEKNERNPLFYDSIGDAVNPALLSAGTVVSPVTFENLGITGLAETSLLDIQGWQFSGTFSATDADTVAWTSGTITLSNGTTFSIGAGNTGNMVAITYIYFDKATSEVALQTTTTNSTSVGANKILIAVAENNTDATSDATFQVFGGKGGVLFKSDNIAANTITANEIATNTITANKMSVSQLSAIAADLGTITAGTITGAIIRTAASGARLVFDSSSYIQAYDANKLRAQLVTDELRFYNDQVGDTDYIGIKALDETLGGLSFHSLKFVETWGTGYRALDVGMHILPDTDSTWDLGLQEAGGTLAWRSVYADEVVTDKIDLLNASRLNLPAKIASSLGIYATDTTKYLNIDTDRGTVSSTGADATNGPYITTDYHVIRFITDAGGDTGHVVAGAGSTIGAEIGTLATNSHLWILMYADGTNGRIQTGGYGGGTYGGALILSPANGNVVLEDSDNLLMYQESGKYFTIEASGGYLNITPTGFTGSYGIKTATWIVPSADDSIWLGTADLRWHDIRSNLINGADIGFDNDWYLTEAEKLGITKKGIALVDEDDELKMFIGEDGIYLPKGKIKNLDTLPWVKTTLEQRSKMDKNWRSRTKREYSNPVYDYPNPDDAKIGGGIYQTKFLW